TLATGGWLDLLVINYLITPDRDFHSVRNDKLRLSHDGCLVIFATGGWLDLLVINYLITPDRDFHSVRNDKLRLSHGGCLQFFSIFLLQFFYKFFIGF
ncbi:hypothetical protein, partial [Candidatus Venteria ishoeyi]|uniref:hypothetical protein n=1 Tax=Candidatus Venteria ishoeyi TaxID=1899563 RepID=UPI00255CC38C